MRYNEIISEAAVPAISPQQAKDVNMFGPMYHGTQGDLGKIIAQGFDTRKSMPTGIGGWENRPVGTSHGYGFEEYGYTGIAAPIHHLGFGSYFTTVKAIAKQYSGGTMKGQRTFYLDTQNVLTINFGAPNTMMKWWRSMGYDMTVEATKARDFKAWFAATKKLTDNLSSQYDAVHFLGKSIRKLLDGDQVCVYRTDLIRVVDPAMASGLEVGSKVTHTQKVKSWGERMHNALYVDDLRPDDFGNAAKLGPGWRGVFRQDESDEDIANRKARGIGRYPIHFIPPPGMVGIIVDAHERPKDFGGGMMYQVKWQKGGVMYNYTADELQPYVKKSSK